MADVKNWQLGREMYFPYEEAHPQSQFAFVFNINRCIACQTCTMACKSTWTFSKGQEYMWWNNVETKPYGGYPQGWDVKLLSMMEEANPDGQVWEGRTFQGKTVFELGREHAGEDGPKRALGYLPTDAEWRYPNIGEDVPATASAGKRRGMHEDGVALGPDSPAHKTWFFYLQRLCNHCSYPACLAACPRKAIYKRPEDGIVLVDQERCRGYRKCMEACPYKKPMYRSTTRVTEKCIGCFPRVEGKDPLGGGAPMETRCMASCVGKIRMQGLVKIGEHGEWAEDRQNPIYFLVKVAKVALPLYPQFGTQPNGYYIPPRWAPRPYLSQMFGPGVEEAIAAYTAPSRELLAVLSLFRATQKIIFRYEVREGPKKFETTIAGKKWELFDDTVIAYGKDGREIARTTVEEPLHVRSDKHANSI
ncbi:MAG TPA: 4Fe-4S dicluster domain-containing protein [Myxococcaceae bacterium]|nr:4Fe-4S dicluster domain-containing protein [Myxococcaceae bacterium]